MNWIVKYVSHFRVNISYLKMKINKYYVLIIRVSTFKLYEKRNANRYNEKKINKYDYIILLLLHFR